MIRIFVYGGTKAFVFIINLTIIEVRGYYKFLIARKQIVAFFNEVKLKITFNMQKSANIFALKIEFWYKISNE